MIKLKVELPALNEEQLTRLAVEASRKLPIEQSFVVYFSDRKPARSSSQNRYLWGVVYKTISNQTGYEVEEIHEMCKVKFGLRTSVDFTQDEVIEFPKSTRKMDSREMTNYIDKIRAWASTIGIDIPEPGRITDEDYITSLEYY